MHSPPRRQGAKSQNRTLEVEHGHPRQRGISCPDVERREEMPATLPGEADELTSSTPMTGEEWLTSYKRAYPPRSLNALIRNLDQQRVELSRQSGQTELTFRKRASPTEITAIRVQMNHQAVTAVQRSGAASMPKPRSIVPSRLNHSGSRSCSATGELGRDSSQGDGSYMYFEGDLVRFGHINKPTIVRHASVTSIKSQAASIDGILDEDFNTGEESIPDAPLSPRTKLRLLHFWSAEPNLSPS